MKKEMFSLSKTLNGPKSKLFMAAMIGGVSMVLILLSELGSEQKVSSLEEGVQSVITYQLQLESRLEELISQMNGAGKTTVMVTLETGEEAVYAVDTRTGDMQTQKTHVLLDDGTALKETVYLPQVCGVAILCEGGSNIQVTVRITEMVSALLDIPSNRICVAQRRS